MINRKFKRMVSVFLCFAVAAGLVPLSAAAVEKQPEIVSELTEMRDEYEKHFLKLEESGSIKRYGRYRFCRSHVLNPPQYF